MCSRKELDQAKTTAARMIRACPALRDDLILRGRRAALAHLTPEQIAEIEQRKLRDEAA